MSSPKPSSPSRSEARRCIVRIFLPENMGSGHLSLAYEPHLSIGELRHQCMDTIRKKRHISHPLISASLTQSPPSSPRLVGVDTTKLDVVSEEGGEGDDERFNEKQYGLALRHGTSADWDRNFDQATILADNKMLVDFHPDKSRFIEFNLYHIDEQEQHPRSVANTLYSRSFSPKASVTINTFSPPHGNSAPTTFNLAAFSRSNTGGTATASPPSGLSPSTSPRISTTPAVASVPWSDDAPTRERGYAHSPDPIEEVRCGVPTCTNVDTSGRGYCTDHANRVPDFNSPIPTSPLTQLSTTSISQSVPGTISSATPKPSSLLSTSASPPKSTSSLPPPSPSSPRQSASSLKSATPPTSSSMPHTHTQVSPSSSPAISPTSASPRTISGETAARPAMPQRRAPTVPPSATSSSSSAVNTSNASRPTSPAPRSPSPATVAVTSPPSSNPASPSSFTHPLASNHISTTSTPTPSTSTSSTTIPTGPLSPGHPDACAHCHVMLVATNYVTVLNKKYHPDHFCCKQCGVKLIGQKFRAHANEPYCPADYDQLFAKKCFACHKAIAGQCLTLDGESYHPDCFKCCKCQCDLSNQRLNTHDGKMYCEKDYHTAFGTQCVGCGEPIIDRILTALDATWHVNCFMCSHCLKPLEGTKFFLKNEHVYCPEDYDLLFSIRCGGCHDKIIGSYIIVESLDQKFHPGCLKCCYCQVNLDNRPFFCDDNSDDIYCREHYEAMVAVKCASCQQFITGTVLHAAGRTYHDECFECYVCQQELDDGSYILDSDGHLFCQQHISSATGDIIHGTTTGARTPRERPTSPTTSVRPSVAPIPIPPSKGNALTNAIHRVKQTISSNPNATVTPSAPTSNNVTPSTPAASASTSATAATNTRASTSLAPSTREATPPPQVDPNAGAAVVTIATTAPEQALTQDSHAPPQEEHTPTPASPSPSPSPSSNTRSIASPSPSPTSSTRSVNASSPSSAPVSVSVSSPSSSVSRLPLSPICATDDPLRSPSIIPTSSISSVKSSTSSTSLSSIKPVTIMNGSGQQVDSRASTISTVSNGSVDDSDDSDDEDSPKKKKKKKSPVQAVKGKGVTWTPSELCEFICAGIEATLAYRDETFRSDYRKKDLYRLMHKNIQYQFQDYAPRIFLMMRRQYGISQSSYIKSICKGGIHGGALGAGKSGMLFYFSNDNRYVVKTITRGELKFFRKILRPYYNHFTQHTHTMLPRFFGIYKITMPGQKPLRLIVMNNLFDFPIQIHTKFDLKGSTRNRFVKNEAKASVLKDLNFKTKIFVGATQKKAIMHQLKIDSEFLVKANIMDQSLLLGIHNGGDDELNDPQTPINVRSLTKPMQPDIYHGDGLMLSVFQSNKGGLRGFDDDGSKTPKPRRELYIMGVIDILQEFNVRKMLESTYKGIRYNKNTISAIASREYADRFLKYLDEHME